MMNKVNLSAITKSVRTALKKHSPEILTGIGIAGMITTTIMAVKATPKALMLIDEKKHEENVEQLTKIEVVKTAWKPYVPTVLTAAASVACLVGASSVNFKRNAALATAYSLSETALREYKDKVIETIGEKKEQSVRDAVIKDKVNKNPVERNEVIITDNGETLCYDVQSGRYFKSDINTIKKAINKLNRQMLTDMFISLNELYYEIGLSTIELGDELGWHIDRGLIDIAYSSQLAADDRPCLVIDYRVAPQYDYRK